MAAASVMRTTSSAWLRSCMRRLYRRPRRTTIGSLRALALGGAACVALGCGHAPAHVADAASDAAADAPAADWVIQVDPSAPAGHLSPALLGQYDLSGRLFDYAGNAALVARMKAIGFAEWRVGLGRWEISTRLLPALTDGSSCAAALAGFPATLMAPAGSTDASLVAERDWFTYTGAPATLADTADDARYALGYIRGVLDEAAAFGATPFVDIDHMPRALSVDTAFARGGTVQGLGDPCFGTWTNHVSNARPADNGVFAAAVVGAVRRVVEGSGGEPPRVAPYWEVWNEPELGYAWDPAAGTLDDYFTMAATTLVQLAAYRAGSTNPAVQALRFGLGSFASAQTAATVIGALDQQALPDGSHVPFDFVSFHSYSNDPLAIVADIQKVAAARAASAHYRGIELALSEWGPNLASPPPATTMDEPLLVATVLARGAALGLDHAHHSLFFDFAPGLAETLVAQDGTVKPAYYAYAMLNELIGPGSDRLAPAGAPDGALDGGMGAVLAAGNGLAPEVRVLLVNREATARTARIEVPGGVPPTSAEVFDDPAAPPHQVDEPGIVTVPPHSLVLVKVVIFTDRR